MGNTHIDPISSLGTMGNRLSDRRILVVGASRGMGRAFAESFAREGADIALSARSKDELDEIADMLDGRTLSIQCDVSETSEVNRLVDDVADEFGRIDAIVNTVGVLTRGELTEATDQELEYVVDVNLLGMLRLARAGIPRLIETEGTFISVSSEAAERGVPGLSAYSGTKGAVNSLTRQLAIECAPDNVTFNAIAPGTTKTSMNEEVRRTDPDWEKRRSETIPLGKLATPADMTDAAVFLASDGASHITGEIIAIDGGSTVKL